MIQINVNYSTRYVLFDVFCVCNFSGSTYHLLKQFVQYNFALNMQFNTSSKIVWPLVAFMSDSVVMWKKLRPSGRYVRLS